jgi:ABC-type sugar transport system permease subunit
MAFFKSVIMASWVIPVAATVSMFKFMAQSDVGLINIILKSIGLKHWTRYWLGDPHAALPFIMLLILMVYFVVYIGIHERRAPT